MRCRNFSAFEKIEKLGEGTFGCVALPCHARINSRSEVYKCLDRDKRDTVAAKKVLLKREMEGVRCIDSRLVVTARSSQSRRCAKSRL